MPSAGEKLQLDSPSLRDHQFRALYEGYGADIRDEFVMPALDRSVAYDRLTGYFTVTGLASTADGIQGIWRRKGKMRLILGIHDVPPEIARAVDPERYSQSLVDALRERLLRSATTLREEFLRDRLTTLAWMMQDGLLQVKVAAPKAQRSEGAGIFHQKRLIFSDSHGNAVAATGSPNETLPGLSQNAEELTVVTSWEVPGHVKALQESFEKTWSGARPELSVIELDVSFANQLLQALGNPPRPTALEAPSSKLIHSLLRILRESQLYGPLNLGNTVLFPHQERAVIDALSRWPVRVLLADEVGLGKTLEAGATIASLLRDGKVTSVTILTPKNVMRQWQDELQQHFGLAFWVYDSAQRLFVSPEGRTRRIPKDQSPSDKGPNLKIISAQLARGHRTGGHFFTNTKRRPDMLVVDEAHAARVRREIDGARRPTLLWRMLQDVAPKVPHVLLLTATPVQLEPAEYHSLLELVGLTPHWSKLETFEHSLRVLANGEDLVELEDAKRAVRWLGEAAEQFGRPVRIPVEGLATEKLANPGLAEAIAARKSWKGLYPELVATHPASLLTIRNTRRVLQRYNYRFPERELEAPSLVVSEAVKNFYHAVDSYLADAYGTIEQACYPNRRISMGFVRSSYQQRLASSLHAARLSLARRLKKVQALGKLQQFEEEEEEDDDEEETSLADFVAPAEGASHEAIQRAHDIEVAHVRGLLERLDRMERQDVRDPKMQAVEALIRASADSPGILVFSRYTDTVARCIEEFEKWEPGNRPGYAKYTGQEAWICPAGDKIPATKEGVRRALEQGDVRIVFCSDAASEGLNLQAANILVNIDVPWNPARLEQRIGRVARLGQKAATVKIVNLWYPDSVEAHMYGRLLQRREDYELAVGECPAIFAQAIRAEVMQRLGHDAPVVQNPFEALQRVRNGVQDQALKTVWNRDFEEVPGSMAMRRRLLEAIAKCDPTLSWDGARLRKGAKGPVLATAEPGQSSSLSFQSVLLHRLSVGKGLVPDSLSLIELEGRAFALAKTGEAGTIRAFEPHQVPDLIACFLGGTELPEPTGPAGHLGVVVKELMASSRWAPKASILRTIGPDTPGKERNAVPIMLPVRLVPSNG